jgi:hypothetical protein
MANAEQVYQLIKLTQQSSKILSHRNAGLFHSLVLEICQEDNLTQRRKDAKKNQVFWAEDTKIFSPLCGFALNFYLFHPCNFNPSRERNGPAPQRGEEKDKPLISEGLGVG